MLEGFFPNRDVEQLRYLHEFYQVDLRNVAFKRAILLCHKDMVATYSQHLAPYIERGLVILPLCLGIPDLGGFAFEVMLEWAVGGDHNAVYKNICRTPSAAASVAAATHGKPASFQRTKATLGVVWSFWAISDILMARQAARMVSTMDASSGSFFFACGISALTCSRKAAFSGCSSSLRLNCRFRWQLRQERSLRIKPSSSSRSNHSIQ